MVYIPQAFPNAQWLVDCFMQNATCYVLRKERKVAFGFCTLEIAYSRAMMYDPQIALCGTNSAHWWGFHEPITAAIRDNDCEVGGAFGGGIIELIPVPLHGNAIACKCAPPPHHVEKQG